MNKIFLVLEKLMVPIFLGFLAFLTANSSNKIMQQQTQLISIQNEKNFEDSKRQLELKYLELFYQDINSNDAKTQSKAIGLLTLMNPEFGQQLSRWIKINIQIEPENKIKIEKVDKELSKEVAAINPSPVKNKSENNNESTIDFDDLKIDIPTSISPNSKGNDNKLEIRNNQVNSITIQIYSKYGKLIFKDTGNYISWNGNDSNGKLLPQDYYPFIIEVTTKDNKTARKNGEIFVLH